jgi:murein DD-endopeptidase MepM/ murein hydrolase activator NlpD
MGLLDRNSHFSNVHRRGGVPSRVSVRNLPQVYIPAGQGSLPALYLRDAKTRRLISRLKWFISTCIVAAAGLCIIAIVVYASSNIEDGHGMMSSLRRVSLAAMTPQTGNIIEERVALMGSKTDKIKMTSKGLTTQYLIHDKVAEHRDAREFFLVKPYLRIVASLSTVPPDDTNQIPPFNPFDLYADQEPVKTTQLHSNAPKLNNDLLTTRVLDLTTGSLLEEDGLSLSSDAAERYVAEADAIYAESAQLRPGIMPGDEAASADSGTASDGSQNNGVIGQTPGLQQEPPFTTTKAKTLIAEDDDSDDSEMYWAIVKRGDTLTGILKAVGAETWQAQSIAEALNTIPGGLKLLAGQEVRMRLIPAASDPSAKEPLTVSIFTGVNPVATVERSGDGGYTLTENHIPATKRSGGIDNIKRATIYNSVYSTCLRQNLDQSVTQKLLRIMSYDVDFKQKVRPGDSFELFFEAKQNADGDNIPGKLLYVAMTVEGETTSYYRFRASDGTIDFYNGRGSNSRKFLMKKPVKVGRFTSGFGYRVHPLLGIRRMHTGVDWAAPRGTPIMAAGSGVIEEAGLHGGYGRYIRIRHSNGYKTAYGHMNAIAQGIKTGMKVRQGQLIGQVGSTGMSTGPHLHFEVLINNRHTNPMKINVPRGRQLSGRQFADFKKEQTHIDALRQRAPIDTKVANVDDQSPSRTVSTHGSTLKQQ